MFLVIIFLTLGGQIVFRANATKLQVGFMIGAAAMLCELFFVLMVCFFVLGTEATQYGQSKLLSTHLVLTFITNILIVTIC